MFVVCNIFHRLQYKAAAMANSTQSTSTSHNSKTGINTKSTFFSFAETFKQFEITRISNVWLYPINISILGAFTGK